MITSGTQVNEKLYAKEPIHTSKEAYESTVRNAILDFILKMEDRGEEDRAEAAKEQLKNLDAQFKFKG